MSQTLTDRFLISCVLPLSAPHQRVIATLGKPLVEATNNMAKLTALIEGLKICKVLKIEKVEVEGDSAIIINALRKGSMPNWRLNSLLTIALDFTISFRRCTFNHIYREGNSKADSLANKGADGICLSTKGQP